MYNFERKCKCEEEKKKINRDVLQLKSKVVGICHV